MNFDEIELRQVSLDLKEAMATSLGTETRRELILLGARSGDRWMYGEASPLGDFRYNHESPSTVKLVARNHVVPALRNAGDIEDYHAALAGIKGHRQAVSMGDQLCYYHRSHEEGKSVAELIGGTNDSAHCGVSIGIKDDDEIVRAIERYLGQGYERIKVKIRPGRDYEYLAHIREHFPDTDLMADANSAYRLEDADELTKLDAFNLTMIEQPMAESDLVNHSILAERLATPICLDESIRSAADVHRAARIGACEIVNLKPQRVGGYHESVRVNRACADVSMDMWIGGMLESGIGQSMAIIASSLSEVDHPGDIGSSTGRYFHDDIVDPPIDPVDGEIEVPDEPGLDRHVDRDRLDRYTVAREAI